MEGCGRWAKTKPNWARWGAIVAQKGCKNLSVPGSFAILVCWTDGNILWKIETKKTTKNVNPHLCVGPGWLQKAGTGSHIGPKKGPKICPCQAVSRNRCVGQMETYFGRLKRKKQRKTLIPMSAWAQDGSKRQALAAILAQKRAQKSVRARQFREIGVLDRWKHTLED